MTDPSTARRTDTRDPRRARERALKLLFQVDLRGLDAADALERAAGDDDVRALLDASPEAEALAPATTASPAPIDGFTRALVLGVAEHRAAIDELIGRHAHHWQVTRMPLVDRNVLRLAVYELQHEPTSPAVVINEAVELAKRLSTDDSGRFVNGVLESVRRSLYPTSRHEA